LKLDITCNERYNKTSDDHDDDLSCRKGAGICFSFILIRDFQASSYVFFQETQK